jgi:hypothetical protein
MICLRNKATTSTFVFQEVIWRVNMNGAILGIAATVSLWGIVNSGAEAKTNFNLYLGVPYYDEQIGPDYDYYPNRGWYRGYDRPRYNRSFERMSCGEARSIVRGQGYRKVVARECTGRTYTFSARRNNERVTVYIDARTGSIRRG